MCCYCCWDPSGRLFAQAVLLSASINQLRISGILAAEILLSIIIVYLDYQYANITDVLSKYTCTKL